MALSAADLARIQGQIGSGVAEVRDRDQSVKYRSLEDLKAIEADAQADVDTAAGTPHRRLRRIVTASGL